MKLKLVTGFRKDQEFSIPAEEAHKAYYLFNNPDARTTFSNGLAIKGSDIERIVPDYVGSMGWNETHRLDEDDMNEIRQLGVDTKLRSLMSAAQAIAKICQPQELNLSLEEVLKNYPRLSGPTERGGEVKRIGDIKL